jgi:hypothetical protein
MLENLTSLTIIADTPRDLKDDSEGAEPLRGWLGPIFQYINEQLAPDVNITIDDDGLPVTESLVEKSFTRRNVGRVETVKGDAYFMRGSMALFA